MLRKTRGIILHVTDFSETSIVAKIYTEDFGMQSYLIHGVRKKKSKVNTNIFQSLSLVDLVAYQKQGEGLKKVSEINCNPQFATIPYDIIKSSIAIFLNEVIYRSIREEESNPEMFEFLHNSIRILDMNTTDCSAFHLYFMIQFTRYLGFFPNSDYEHDKNIFNLQEGKYQSEIPSHSYYLDQKLTAYFQQLINSSFENYHLIEMNYRDKHELLTGLVMYFELHHTHGTHLKSFHVLHEVMN